MGNRSAAGDGAAPFGIDAAVGGVAVVACCAVPAGTDAAGREARFALLVLCVAIFAATVGDLAAVAVTAGVAFLIYDGFVEGHQGDLVWTGRGDLVRVALLYGAGLLGLLLGLLVDRVHRRRRRRGPVLPRQRVSGEQPAAERDRSHA